MAYKSSKMKTKNIPSRYMERVEFRNNKEGAICAIEIMRDRLLSLPVRRITAITGRTSDDESLCFFAVYYDTKDGIK